MATEPNPRSELARELVLAHSWNPIAYQLLNPGIQHWFSARRDALIGHIDCQHIRVVAGAPVCDPARILEVAQEFEADAERHREHVCYFHVGPRFVNFVRPLEKYSVASIGSLPYWNPAGWQAIMKSDASLRYQVARARNKAITAHEISAESDSNSSELRAIREEWLRRKHLPPLHFLTEPEIFEHLADRRLFVAQRDGEILAYLLCTPMPNRHGWLFEQWARGDHAPLGTSELLVDFAMSTFAHEGCTTVTLGLSPLSVRGGIAPGEFGPLWLRALFRFMRLTANPLYNFKGLEHYKYKLRPHWSEPAYVVVNNPHFRPINVFAIALAFMGSPLQLFAWRTLKKNLAPFMPK